jgi:hypothetical protein
MIDFWVDYDFYENEFLTVIGSPPVVPKARFNEFILTAQNRLNQRGITIEKPPDELKYCLCALAKYLLETETLRTESGGGTVTSFNNQGYSKTFSADISQLDKKETQGFWKIAKEWLKSPEMFNIFISRRAK